MMKARQNCGSDDGVGYVTDVDVDVDVDWPNIVLENVKSTFIKFSRIHPIQCNKQSSFMKST